MSSYRKFTFAISSPDEFLVSYWHSSSRGDKQDSLSRRNAFIGEVNSVLCYFGNPKVTQNTINVNYESIYYACSDYPAYWDSLLLLRPGCLLHIVLVSTGVFYGICLAVPYMIFFRWHGMPAPPRPRGPREWHGYSTDGPKRRVHSVHPEVERNLQCYHSNSSNNLWQCYL